MAVDIAARTAAFVCVPRTAGDGNKPGIRRSASAASSLDSDLVSGETGAGAATGARGAQVCRWWRGKAWLLAVRWRLRCKPCWGCMACACVMAAH
jgi:hypothetical protein